MRIIVLVLAWVSPALIAEMLGWKSIWGSGSVLLDALIPFPVAGGILHVVSFSVVTVTILTFHKLSPPLKRIVPAIAIAVFTGMLALQIDYERLNAWIFTDYQPFGSPIRLDSNLLSLFITTDAFWVSFYSLLKGRKLPLKFWTVLPLVPIFIIGLFVVKSRIGGPEYKIGGSFPGNHRGQEIRLIYTSGGYDRNDILTWFESTNYLSRPWQSPNYEHSTVYFTSSLQAVKWRKLDMISEKNTLATFCLYEEDMSMTLHEGYVDCFSGRDTLEEKLKKYAAANPTGFGKHIDYWFAQVMLCAETDIPPGYVGDIAHHHMCRLLNDNYEKQKQRFINLYGSNSPELNFVEITAKKNNLYE